jgi:hypothetical protein
MIPAMLGILHSLRARSHDARQQRQHQQAAAPGAASFSANEVAQDRPFYQTLSAKKLDCPRP